MRWKVEKGFKVRLPRFFNGGSLADVRHQLQREADKYIPADDAPPLGELQFRYELDGDDEPLIMHVYYLNKGGARDRFARLVRVS